MDQQNRYVSEVVRHAVMRMDENTKKIEKCLKELSEDEVWQKPNKASNSIANLLLHLCGNIRQYAISSLGRRPDVRERDLEFSTEKGYEKADLFTKLSETVEEAKAIIKKIDIEEMLRIRFVQGYEFSGIGVLIHVVEHYSYHTGQIIFWTKLLREKDMAFYAGIDLNAKNE